MFGLNDKSQQNQLIDRPIDRSIRTLSEVECRDVAGGATKSKPVRSSTDIMFTLDRSGDMD